MHVSPAMYARRHSHERLKRAASDPSIVPRPCAATSAARPEALVPSTSRASSTSPMFVTPANSTAAVELASSRRTSARPPIDAQPDAQVGPQRACARRGSPLRRSRRGPIVVSSTAETANETALAPSSAAGAHEREQPDAERRPGGQAEIVERAEQAERRRATLPAREARDARQRGGREQRAAEARQRGADDHPRQRVRERDEREGHHPQQVRGDRARPPADAVHQRAEQRAEEDRRQQVRDQHRGHRPGRAACARRPSAASPRARGRSRGTTVRAR